MRNFKKIFLCFLFVGLNLITLNTEVFAQPPAAYAIYFASPQSMQWKIADDKEDGSGYVKSYLPNLNATDQSLTITYIRDKKTSLKDSMQEAIADTANIDCGQKVSHTYSEEPNAITFSIFMSRCVNGTAFALLYKIFNMSDGQYLIRYTANPNVIPQPIARDMFDAIKSAQIVPAQ